MNQPRFRSLVIVSLALSTPFAHSQSVTLLGFLTDGPYSEGFGVSADGMHVAGRATHGGTTPLARAVHWTQATGLVDLGTFGGSHSFGNAISHDGQFIVGGAQSNPYYRAFRWSQGTGLVDLGTLGGPASQASDVSADGSVVVGQASPPAGQDHAFRWTTATGMQDLGPGNANGVSADGNTVVGGTSGGLAFRWTSATGTQTLGTLGGLFSQAYATSADGTVVTGDSRTSANFGHAFRWTQATGMVDLGTLGGDSSIAFDMSSDGSTIVGWSYTVGVSSLSAFRWTSSAGMEDLNVEFASVIPQGWYLIEAMGISPDGRYIVGAAGETAPNGRTQGFILDTVPEPTSLLVLSAFSLLLVRRGARR